MIGKLIVAALAAASFAGSASAESALRYAAPLPHGRCMITGMTPKPSINAIFISFGVTFKKTPVVTVTPTWLGSNHSVGGIETVIDLGTDHFTGLSANGGTDYYLSWTAVGVLKAKACV
jgi:hypothetical protein